jgi:hypothetical protein
VCGDGVFVRELGGVLDVALAAGPFGAQHLQLDAVEVREEMCRSAII